MDKNLIIERKGSKIYSHIRKKWLVELPEERVRQEFVLVLVNQYGYSLDQMDEELRMTGRGSGGGRADIAIWRTNDEKNSKTPPFIIVECKADNILISDDDYLQGEYYARNYNAPFFVTHNNSETKYWKILKDKIPGQRQEIEDIPKAGAKEREIEELLKKLKVFKENEFADLLHACHNIIRNREKLDPAAAFDEIAKVLFMKVYAERYLKSDMKGNIFTLEYIEQGEKFNPDYLQDIFGKTKKEFGKAKLFGKEERINLRANTIKPIVEKLEKYNLSATSTDVKGIAFEKFLGKTFRGEIGQFFTPRSVVKFMVQMMNPQEGEVVCDPASGSGGFLIRVFEVVREKIHASVDKEYKKQKDKIEKQKISEEEKAKLLNETFEQINSEIDQSMQDSRAWKLANRCIYGTDANDRMARTSKMNMIMHGDGHGGIHHHDGFLDVNGIFEGRFDLVLTNPPFGANVEKDDVVIMSQVEVDYDTLLYYRKVYGDKYDEANGRLKAHLGKPITELFELPKSKSIKTEILFIERCLDLLKEGGRLAIVLPEGIFNNSNSLYVRHFVEDRAYLSAVVSLPQETFSSAGASVKASLLFVKKFTDQEKQKWDKILNKKRSEILEDQSNERMQLSEMVKGRQSDKDSKKEAKRKIQELDKQVDVDGRKNAREEFDYHIFMAEAASVGISSTGETGDSIPSELPEILAQYREFEKDHKAFINLREN